MTVTRIRSLLASATPLKPRSSFIGKSDLPRVGDPGVMLIQVGLGASLEAWTTISGAGGR
jgi:hypothetical protein